MAVLEKIRVKMGLFITVVIALALLSFIIDPSTLQSTLSMFSSKYDVGEINGEGISYQDFQKRVEYFTNIYQITNGNANSSEETQQALNNAAWQNEISQNVLVPTAEKAGLRVGDDELFDLSQGSAISPVIEAEAAFKGENGEFSKERVVEFVKAINQDNTGKLAMYWDYLENNMKIDQMLTKYLSLLSKSNFTTPVEAKAAIAENNTSYDISFVVKPIGFAPDSTITVSNAEIKEYYNKHKNMFEQPASSDILYAVFTVVPSQKDIADAEQAIAKEMEGFAAAENMKTFLSRKSDQPFNATYYKEGELSSYAQEVEDFAKSAKVGDVLPYFKNEDSYVAAKLMDVKQLPDSVFVKHILLQGEKAALADSLKNVILKGGDFAAIAAEYSADQNPNVAEPGDLGWLTQQYMLPGFESLLFEQAGKVAILNTNYGTHIAKVVKTTKPVRKAQVALLVKEIIPSKQTYADHYAEANAFVQKCDGKLENFRKAAKEDAVYIAPALRVLPSARAIANYSHVREVVRWVNEAKVGDASPIITIDSKYFFVVAKTAEHVEGVAPLQEISTEIREMVALEKRKDKMLKEAAEQTAGLTSLEAIAEKLGTTVSNQTGVTFSTLTSQQLDPSFLGAVAVAPKNQLVGPVKGEVGIFFFTLNNTETGAYYTAEDAQQKKDQFFAFVTRMLPDIICKDKVKDQRYKFY